MLRSLCKIPPVLFWVRPSSAQLVAVKFVVHDVVFVVFQILLILLTPSNLHLPVSPSLVFFLSLPFLVITGVASLQSSETH